MFRPLTVAALLATTLCGCVMSSSPVGDEPLALVAEEWEGIWIAAGASRFDADDLQGWAGDDGALTIRVVDAAAGKLEVHYADASEEPLALATYEVLLRQSGDWVFASRRVEGDNALSEGQQAYLFFKILKTGEQVIVWGPNPERVSALVEEGALPAQDLEGSDENLLLAPLAPAHMELFMSTDRPLFLWDEPVVLRRVSQ